MFGNDSLEIDDNKNLLGDTSATAALVKFHYKGTSVIEKISLFISPNLNLRSVTAVTVLR